MIEMSWDFYIGGAIAIIGSLEWLKHTKINIKWMPYISLLFCIIAGSAAAYSIGFTVWNAFACIGGLLAVTQLGYQAIVEGICGAINKMMAKLDKVGDKK